MTEMAKLAALLTEACIPFENNLLFDTSQIIYPSNQNRVCDVICHKYSCGYEKGLLEIMGLTDNEGGVEGCLTAEEVFDKINKHYMIKEVHTNPVSRVLYLW